MFICIISGLDYYYVRLDTIITHLEADETQYLIFELGDQICGGLIDALLKLVCANAWGYVHIYICAYVILYSI